MYWLTKVKYNNREITLAISNKKSDAESFAKWLIRHGYDINDIVINNCDDQIMPEVVMAKQIA